MFVNGILSGSRENTVIMTLALNAVDPDSILSTISISLCPAKSDLLAQDKE